MVRALAVLAAAAGLAACATPTPYQPMQHEVGYAEQQLESNRYRVWFAGNSVTPRATVENYVLYRCAELTLDKGFDYFVMSDRATDREHDHSRRGGISFGFGGFRFGSRSGVGIGVGTGPYGGDERDEYYGTADIVLVKGKKPAGNPAAFDAREIKVNLEGTIARPEPDD